MKDMIQYFREVTCLNEVEGNMNAVLRLTDPDGKPGRSGYSFGLTQMDTRHNDGAINCLVDCGFTQDEIHGIVDQTIDVRPFTVRLIANKAIIEKYDEAQLNHCLTSAMNAATANGVMVTNPGGILCLADYVNQYGSIGPAFIEYLNKNDLDGDITHNEVQAWKLTTKYGREHKGDCERRYKNILKVLKENGLDA